jgi:hypothetical protein
LSANFFFGFFTRFGTFALVMHAAVVFIESDTFVEFVTVFAVDCWIFVGVCNSAFFISWAINVFWFADPSLTAVFLGDWVKSESWFAGWFFRAVVVKMIADDFSAFKTAAWSTNVVFFIPR